MRRGTGTHDMTQSGLSSAHHPNRRTLAATSKGRQAMDAPTHRCRAGRSYDSACVLPPTVARVATGGRDLLRWMSAPRQLLLPPACCRPLLARSAVAVGFSRLVLVGRACVDSIGDRYGPKTFEPLGVERHDGRTVCKKVTTSRWACMSPSWHASCST